MDSAALLSALKCVACAQSDDDSLRAQRGAHGPTGRVWPSWRRMGGGWRCEIAVDSQLATIPTKAVTELVRMLSGAAEVRLSGQREHGPRGVRTDDAFTCKLIDGTYPELEAGHCQRATRTATINRAELLDAINRAGLISRMASRRNAVIHAAELTIRAEHGRRGRVHRSHPRQVYDGDAAEITVSPDFMAT